LYRILFRPVAFAKLKLSLAARRVVLIGDIAFINLLVKQHCLAVPNFTQALCSRLDGGQALCF